MMKFLRQYLVLAVLLGSTLKLAATTYYSRQTGNWNATTSWSTVACGNATNSGTFPVAGDIVNICGAHTITVIRNTEACATLNVSTSASAKLLISNSSNYGTLTVSGTITMTNGTIEVGASDNHYGRLNAGNITVTVGTFTIRDSNADTCRTIVNVYNTATINGGTWELGTLSQNRTLLNVGKLVLSSGTLKNQYKDSIMVYQSTGLFVGDGNVTFSGGTVSSATSSDFSLYTQGTGVITCGGTAFSAFSPNLIASTSGTVIMNSGTWTCSGNILIQGGRIQLNGIAFPAGSNACTIRKTGAGDDYSKGGNTFASATNFKIENTGTGNLYLSHSPSPLSDTYPVGNIITYTVSGGGSIYPAYNANATYNANIRFNIDGGGGIYWGKGTGTATLVTGKTIASDATNAFINGTLHLQNFTQQGSVGSASAQTIEAPASGSSTLIVFDNCMFNGSMTARASDIQMKNSTFGNSETSANMYFRITDGSNSASYGGNTFGGASYSTAATILIQHTATDGDGVITLGNSAPDAFKGIISFDLNPVVGSWGQGIQIMHSGTTYAGDIICKSDAAGSTCDGYDSPDGFTIQGTLASGKTISASSTFDAGTLFLKNFTQLGTTAQTITTSYESLNAAGWPLWAYVRMQNCIWNGNVTINTREIEQYIEGCTFNGTFDFTLSSADGPSAKFKGNTFNSTAIFLNSAGSVCNSGCGWAWDRYSGDIYLSYGTVDVFNGDVSFLEYPVKDEATIQPSYSGGTTTYNGNMTIRLEGMYSRCGFGSGGGSSVLPAGKTITVPSCQGGSYSCDGWSDKDKGSIYFKNFTQQGSLTSTNLSGQSGSWILFDNADFANPVTVAFSQVYLKNSRFRSTASFENDAEGSATYYVYNSESAGGNTFDTDVTFKTTGDKYHATACQSLVDTYNGNIYIASNNAAGGIYFGNTTISYGSAGVSSLTATSVLVNATKQVLQVGGTGFAAGNLGFRRFLQQNAATPLTIDLSATGTGILSFDNSTFNSNVSFKAKNISELKASTFNGPATTTIECADDGIAGAKTNTWYGKNTFASPTTTILMSEATAGSTLTHCANEGDVFTGNAIFTLNTATNYYPAAAGTSSFAKNITINGSGATTMTFGNSSGTVKINGTVNQTFIKGGSFTKASLYNLTVDKSAGVLDFTDTTSASVVPVDIRNSLTLTNGLVKTDANKRLVCLDNSTSNGGSATSFVTGPIRKYGDNEFIFPVGCSNPSNVWARCKMSPVSGGAATDNFTVQYYGSAYSNTTTLGAGVNNVSVVEYWDITKTTGSPTVNLSLYWQNQTRSGILNTPMSDLIVAHWTGTQWESKGQLSVPAAGTSGVVSSLNNVNSFSPFTFGSAGASHPLPIGLTSFTGENKGAANLLKWTTVTETNNDYFTLERSEDGITFSEIAMVDGAGNSTGTLNYQYLDENPFEVSYYRLKQTDFNETHSYSNTIVLTNNKGSEISLRFSPNPSSAGQSINMTINGVLLNNNVKYLVYNSLGQKLYEGNVKHNGKYSVHPMSYLGEVQSGTYTISVIIDNKVYKNSLIVN